jgi:hypothetical protein
MTMMRISPRRFVAAGIHLLLSALVAAVVSLLVFRLWYPTPYATIAGGFGLFGLVVGVDLMLGPLLTFVAASPGKSRRELSMDLCLIAIVQLAALGYGVTTMARARPVHLSFEVDRFRVVTAADFEDRALADAPAAMRALPWTGPTLIAAIKPQDPQEQLRAIDLGLAGFDLSMVPRYWAEYAPNAAEAWRVARPVDLLVKKDAALAPAIAEHAAAAGQSVAELRFLPVMSRQASWVALLADGGTRVVGFLPVDGFF